MDQGPLSEETPLCCVMILTTFKLDLLCGIKVYFDVGNEYELDSTKLRKEKLRYRTNWAMLLLLALLDGVYYTAMATTFHQYVINPRRESLGNQSEVG